MDSQDDDPNYSLNDERRSRSRSRTERTTSTESSSLVIKNCFVNRFRKKRTTISSDGESSSQISTSAPSQTAVIVVLTCASLTPPPLSAPVNCVSSVQTRRNWQAVSARLVFDQYFQISSTSEFEIENHQKYYNHLVIHLAQMERGRNVLIPP